jgi:hypothetical protein
MEHVKRPSASADVEAAMPPQDEHSEAQHARARLAAKLLGKFQRTFASVDRRDEPLRPGEIQTLDRVITEIRRMLGDDSFVSPMITELQAALLDAERQTSVLTFDLALRHIGPILVVIEDVYRVDGSSGTSPAAKRGTRSRVDVRIDDAGSQADPDP